MKTITWIGIFALAAALISGIVFVGLNSFDDTDSVATTANETAFVAKETATNASSIAQIADKKANDNALKLENLTNIVKDINTKPVTTQDVPSVSNTSTTQTPDDEALKTLNEYFTEGAKLTADARETYNKAKKTVKDNDLSEAKDARSEATNIWDPSDSTGSVIDLEEKTNMIELNPVVSNSTARNVFYQKRSDLLKTLTSTEDKSIRKYAEMAFEKTDTYIVDKEKADAAPKQTIIYIKGNETPEEGAL